jgi:hypothetical protein
MTKPSVTSFAALNKRQVYSLLLKLLTLFGVVIVMAVMINSLWGLQEVGSDTKGGEKIASSSVMEVVLEDLRQGAMKRVLFQGQDIAILYRVDEVTTSEVVTNDKKETNQLNEAWRSIKSDYFVFINAAGATRCPLHLSADAHVLKDICSGVTYDATGRNSRGGIERLIIPPHYFDDAGVLFLGAWQPK